MKTRMDLCPTGRPGLPGAEPGSGAGTIFDAYVDLARARGICPPRRRLRVTAERCGDLLAAVYEPGDRSPNAVHVFFHGAGANMAAAGYGNLAADLSQLSGGVVLLPDIRGHGMSAGARGYAGDHREVWRDVDLWIDAAQRLHPGMPVILGGHSAGAALVLNRATRAATPLPPAVQGIEMLAPYLIAGGSASDALGAPEVPGGSREAPGAAVAADPGGGKGAMQIPQFSSIDARVFAAHLQAPDGRHAHRIAVHFNYPEELVASGRLVRGYTAEMAIALSPRDVAAQLTALSLPTRIVAATRDQLFPPERIAALCDRVGNPQITLGRVEADHLTCLYHAAPALAAAEG